MRRFLLLLSLVVASAAFAPEPAWTVSGGVFTTVNTSRDGSGHCKNGNPPVNCNIYDGKQFVWLNGGPPSNGLSPDGQYFFAVLEPGGQPNPNDGSPKNLSDDFDAYTNRTFTVTGGEISFYGGTHDQQIPLIRLFPYADTSNPGGVYIMAVCYLGAGYPVDPRDCKYDAFKVQQAGQAQVQHVLAGEKILDTNRNGQADPGEGGIQGFQIQIQCSDGTSATATTDAVGDWTFTTPAKNVSSGTTTCTVSEIQQAGFTQTGPLVDQSMTTGGATVSLSNFVYTVTLPNDTVSTVSELNFENVPVDPPGMLLGDAAVEPSTDSNPAGTAEAFLTTASGSGTLRSLSVYLDASSTATTVIAGLYSGSAGHPGTLLAEGTLSTPVAGAWNVISLPPVTVTAGATYWIALLGPSGAGTVRFRDRCCGGGSPTETSAETALTALPASWTTGTVYSDGALSAYGSSR